MVCTEQCGFHWSWKSVPPTPQWSRGGAVSQTGVDCTWAPEVCQSWRERPPLGRKVRWEGLGSAVGLGGTGSRKWSSPAGSGSLTLSDWYGLYQSRGLPRRWGQHPTGMLVTGSGRRWKDGSWGAGQETGQLESGHSPVLHTGVDF